MSTDLASTDDLRRLAEASAWRVYLSDRDLVSCEAFEIWLTSAPDNKLAWRHIEETWNCFDAIAGSPEMVAARLDALAAGNAQRTGRVLPAWFSRRSIVGAVAAALVVLAVGVGGLTWIFAPTVYATELGERRVIVLADGSKLSLDSSSRVRVR